MTDQHSPTAAAPLVAIIGGGPAGLMAAESASAHGAIVHLFEAMPSVGRKFLMAGKSGLNLTHAEADVAFRARFGVAASPLGRALDGFTPSDIRTWANGLGVETFVGSSGRVFPVDFKAAPLLRAWVRRLRAAGVCFHMRHRWTGWGEAGEILLDTHDGPIRFGADALILALGGGSWPQLGSDGGWVPLLAAAGAGVSPLRPANCGFDVGWSPHFRDRFAGQPVKPVTLSLAGEASPEARRGEFVITAAGIEGGAVYWHSAALRDRIEAGLDATLLVDLAPDRDLARLEAALRRPRGSRSLAEHLRRACGVTGVKAGLLRECLAPQIVSDPAALAAGIKALPLMLRGVRPLAEAISSAGGVRFASLTDNLMLRDRPGVFCTGEMLDWEVTTGGYLLTACLALGRAAGEAAARWSISQLP